LDVKEFDVHLLQLTKEKFHFEIARDMPGMADIDSSLLLFCKYVKPTATVALTGECKV